MGSTGNINILYDSEAACLREWWSSLLKVQMQYLITGNTLWFWCTSFQDSVYVLIRKKKKKSLIVRLTGSNNPGKKAGVASANPCYATFEALVPKGRNKKSSVNYRLQIPHAKETVDKKKSHQLVGVIDSNH